MADENTTDGKLSRAQAVWVVVSALAAFVAGAGIMIDADQWAVSGFGEMLAWSGIMLFVGWLVVRGTRLRIVYPVMIALILAWTFRDVPPGRISGGEVRNMVIASGVSGAVIALLELRDRRKKRRLPGAEETS